MRMCSRCGCEVDVPEVVGDDDHLVLLEVLVGRGDVVGLRLVCLVVYCI